MASRRHWIGLVTALSLAAACAEDPPGKSIAADHDHGVDDDHDHDLIPEQFDASAPPPDGSVIEGFSWNLPAGFPRPVVPADNPMSTAKVGLGRRLFYDKRLSGNETFSCASCHEQQSAFTDGKATAVGSTGQSHPRGSMSLANVAYAASLTWADSSQTELEVQARVPMFGLTPVELGLTDDAQVEERLRAVPKYQPLFAAAFPTTRSRSPSAT